MPCCDEDESLKRYFREFMGLNSIRVCCTLLVKFSACLATLISVSETVDTIICSGTVKLGPMSKHLSTSWTPSTCCFHQLSVEFTTAVSINQSLFISGSAHKNTGKRRKKEKASTLHTNTCLTLCAELMASD